MGIFLIYMIIITLVVIAQNNIIKTNEIISENKFNEFNIENNFYKNDTNLNNKISLCSIEQLKTINLSLENLKECFLFPDTINNKIYSFDNNESGNYKIYYNFNYEKFLNNVENKDKNITNIDNNNFYVIKYFNNTNTSLVILNEISDLLQGKSELTKIDLGLSSDANFVINGHTVAKNTYMLNGVDLESLSYPDNYIMYVSNYNENIIYDYSSDNLSIFVKNGISESIKNYIEYIFNYILDTKYTVINTDETDGSGKIIKL